VAEARLPHARILPPCTARFGYRHSLGETLREYTIVSMRAGDEGLPGIRSRGHAEDLKGVRLRTTLAGCPAPLSTGPVLFEESGSRFRRSLPGPSPVRASPKAVELIRSSGFLGLCSRGSVQGHGLVPRPAGSLQRISCVARRTARHSGFGLPHESFGLRGLALCGGLRPLMGSAYDVHRRRAWPAKGFA